MKRMKLLIVLVSVLLVLPGSVYARSEPEKTDEGVTISILYGLGGRPLTKAINNDDVMIEFGKRTGVTLDWTPSIQNVDWQAALPIMLASGDLPDIIIEGSVELRTKILGAKAAIPLDDLVRTNGQDL